VSLSYEELERLRRLYPLLEALYNVLAEFLGKKPIEEKVEKPPKEKEERKLIIPKVKPTPPPPPPTPTIAPAITVPTIPTEVKIKPYTEHLFTIAEQPIDEKEREFDLGDWWDAIIVLPDIDTYIEFDRKISDRTPIVPGGTTVNAELRVRKIHYKSAVPGLEGTLSIWAFR